VKAVGSNDISSQTAIIWHVLQRQLRWAQQWGDKLTSDILFAASEQKGKPIEERQGNRRQRQGQMQMQEEVVLNIVEGGNVLDIAQSAQ
jgi:hypothetical protein